MVSEPIPEPPKKHLVELTKFDELIMVPSIHMSRYRNLSIIEDIKTKIFGKIKQHPLSTLHQASITSYPSVFQAV